MIKEFEINDILDAVESISKIDKKMTKIPKKKDVNRGNHALILNNQVKSDRSEILVLDQMIE